MTSQEIIEAAFQELGILVAGGTLQPADLTWGLGKLNRFLNTLSADGLNITATVTEVFPTVIGQEIYAIGDSGDFDTTRPFIVENAFIRDSVDHDHELQICSISDYWLINEKFTAGRPTKLFYQGTYPLATIYLHYVPDEIEDLYLINRKNFANYTAITLGDTINLPGQYEDMLTLNLAIRMASRYGIHTSDELVLSARIAMQNVRDLNFSRQLEPVNMNFPGGGCTTYDIEAG